MNLKNLNRFLRSLGIAAMVAVFAGSPEAAAQSGGTITGTVYDETGEPAIGATVKCVEKPSLSQATDIEGNFSISSSKPLTLEISYVGCETQTVNAVPGKKIEITLQPVKSLLDEVVVVGFAVQKKVNLTGAVGVATGKEIQSRPTSNAVAALQGLVPGLNISNSSAGGELNATKSIQVRGTATIGEGSSGSPLVLIDGIEGDLNNVNPQDIENISVLKDAAAASIYGSRAPFGVILVTTKNGAEGKNTIRYSNSFRFNQPLKIADQMDSWHLANYVNDVQRYTSPGTYRYSPEDMEKIRAYYYGESDVAVDEFYWDDGASVWGRSAELMGLYGNYDWMKEYYKDTAFSQEHNLSFNGGNEKSNYYVSGSWMDLGGFMRHGTDDFQRFNINAKYNVRLYNWLKIGFNTRWNRSDYDRATCMDGGFYDNLMRRSISLIPKYDPNGNLMTDYSYIEDLTNGGRHRDQNDEFTNQFTITLTPVKNWNIIGEFNARVNNNWTHEDRFPVYAHDAKDPDKTHWARWGHGVTRSSVKEYSYRSTFLNANIFTNYNLTINQAHNFTFLAGMQIESFKDRYVDANRYDAVSQDIPVLSQTTSKTDYGMGGKYQDWRNVGFFGRINYDYQGRYLLELNLRYDGSSRFRSDSRWVWSPSASAGWNVAQEKFMEEQRNWLDMLKVRASYGQLANQNTNNWYPTYRVMGTSAGNMGWLVDGEKPNKAWFPGLISTSLTWEKIRHTNVGFDFAMLNNRLTGSFDYFWRKNNDMVGPGVTLPATLGTNPPSQNLLSMLTHGWEVTLGWRQVVRDFNYDVRFNLSDDRTKITDYPNREGKLNSYIAGRYTGEIWGLETVGIARTQEEMDAHLAHTDQSSISATWEAGDIMYKDTDGDGRIYQQSTINEKGDLRVIGNSTPRFRYGINLSAGWKGIDFSAFFQGVGKRDYYFNPSDSGSGAGSKAAAFWGATSGYYYESLFFNEHLDYWRDDSSLLGENYDAYYARPLYGTNRNRVYQTRYLQNGAYCRLKNLQVGYTLPKKWMDAIRFQKIRIYFSAENLCTWTKMTKVMDPESLEVSKMKSGGAYPLSRTYSFGIQADF